MQTIRRARSVRALRFSLVRLRRRRLFQGCAALLILPSAALFLPILSAGSPPIHSLAPVAALPLRSPFSRTVSLAQVAVPKHRRGSLLAGLASWYGAARAGYHTASGEIFNPDALTACHRTLPFGTLVRVVNLVNHRSVVVRINDRGTLNANRVIDLSSGAAAALDMLRSGVAPVRLEVQNQGAPEASAGPAADF